MICSLYSTDGRITSDFATQSKLLGGSTPQTPRWGRGAAPKPRSALVFRWDAYRQPRHASVII
ncbi:MAG: hypothetical protein EWV89_04855 [Microcystis wesenbergii Mw_QC_B_20070930_S4]|nr:hypothetical protein [Microcystis aeruginosa W11-03]NCR94348.1 hypothetical protein [Microcystis aeruginosa W11-06]TRU99234.1 MAG: hypothetical protein EWV73_13525 [Microcystis wesenbergii Mw_QC_B_20070930_S4D]TRV16744.1 MAG: hypothetical protein EWV89_04855 [Microcystis wesenbergii Mw_QC_B_20070930_S4]